MAKFPFSLAGYRYHEGVKILRHSFEAASEGLRAEQETAKQSLVEYRAAGEWKGDYDDDGNVMWDQETLLEMDIEAGDEAIMALRKAFVMALYHHWERALRRHFGDDDADHNKLVKRAASSGIPINDKLAGVRDLVNTLKHDNNTKGEKLQKSWSAVLYNPSIKPGAKRIDWYNSINLKEEHVFEAFDIVSTSGPVERPARYSKDRVSIK